MRDCLSQVERGGMVTREIVFLGSEVIEYADSPFCEGYEKDSFVLF